MRYSDVDNSKMEACFHGEIPRECSSCSHYKNGCCYAEEYEDDHKDCSDCYHRDDCRIASMNSVQPRYVRPTRSVVSSGARIRSAATRPVASPQLGFRTVNRGDAIPLSQYGGFNGVMTRVGKDTAWNVGTAIFQSIYEFFVRHWWD